MATTDLGKWMITNGGNYDPEATYEQLTMVMYDNSTYITLKTVTGVTPTNDGVNYILMAQGFDATTLSAVTATDTSGLLGDSGETVSAQSLVDYLADAVATKLLKKTDISTVDINRDDKVPSSSLVHAINSNLSALNSSTLFRYAGSSEPDNKVIRINFTSFNGLMGMIFYSIQAFLMINVDLSQSRTLSGLQQSPIKFTFLNGTIQNQEEIVISIIYNDDNNFQIKLELPQRVPALYLVPICSNFENVSITSTVS